MDSNLLSLICLIIIPCLHGAKHVNVRLSCETSSTSSENKSDCDDSQATYENSSEDKKKKTKPNNLLFVPYPFPIMVPPMPAPPMPLPPPPIPILAAPLLGPIVPGEITKCTTEQTTLQTTLPPTLPPTAKTPPPISRSKDDGPFLRNAMKRMRYNDIPSYLIKNGILPVPDTIAMDLVNRMHEINMKTELPEVAPRRVDQSIFKFNDESKQELVGELRRALDTAYNEEGGKFDLIGEALEGALMGLTKRDIHKSYV